MDPPIACVDAAARVHQHFGRVARTAHTNVRYIAALEAGRINPPFHVLIGVIHALGVTMGELFARYQAHHRAYPARPVGTPAA